jgi:cytochrome oxidase Cu insertion factor (SCO1/SenC/PrrC family)
VREHRLLPTFRWALGTQQELQQVWQAYNIAVLPDVKDTVSHSTVQLLIDPTGHERLVYDANVQAADVIADLKTLQDE